jgi:hypothetical protein
MGADALLSRLDRVKQTGAGRWIARCPGHDDKSPSLAIREIDDGRVLIHDFAGCSAGEVLSAVGLEFDALFPERPVEHHFKKERRPFSALDALRCIAFEATLAAVCASNVARGIQLTDADISRAHTAAGRIQHALEVALG